MARCTAYLIKHGVAARLTDLPVLEPEPFRQCVIDNVNAGGRISALFGTPAQSGKVRLYAVIVHPSEGTIALTATEVDEKYRSITPDCPQAHWFEREIAEQWGVVPEGHPWLKPIRFHRSYRPGHDAFGRKDGSGILPSVTDFFRVEGEEVHEVAVGPVHAGIIEPGHFRFQCHGEHVFNLEISLGYQHRGVERALMGGPNKRTIHLMETLSGDTTVGHATAYCQAVESLSGCKVPPRANAVRAVALELERLANHTGDLGALAGDIGYQPTMSFCGRIRGDFLNMTAMLCGNRFGRGLVRPGGVGFDADGTVPGDMAGRMDAAFRDVEGASALLFDTPTVMARFENTGVISATVCLSLGLVGPAARACGVGCDDRNNFPAGFYKTAALPVATCDSGDVYARALVRRLEIQNSAAYVRKHIAALPGGPINAETGPLAPDSIAVSLVEAWRGEVCHVAITDKGGRFAHYKVVDPSFHNWAGLAMALRGQEISDFPLCNKSFNLSYCGHDL